jgi:CRISPR-associated protein Cas2
MTVVVTRNVSGRMRGFLASSLLELVPGVYSSARISVATRERIWSVVEGWFYAEEDASVIMLWSDRSHPGGQVARWLGAPPLDLVECDGLVLTRKPLPDAREHPDDTSNVDNSNSESQIDEPPF